MPKKPKSTPNEGPAYLSWASDNPQQQSSAFNDYTEGLKDASYAIANTYGNGNRDFRGLTNYIDGGPGLRAQDFDWFRPGQAAPVKPKDIIAFARFAYRRIGLIHNAIDLMGDFSCQGVRLVHPNKRIERFYQDWFTQVQGRQVSERLGHLLFREANVPIRHYTAKINKKKKMEMQKALGAVDLKINMDDLDVFKNEIPWRYTFIDPLLISPVGGQMHNLSNNKVLSLELPPRLIQDIKSLQSNTDPLAKEVLSKISPDIVEAIANNKNKIILPPEKTNIYYYKKDDWQLWADPMTYSAFEPLNLYQRLQLTDKAALDGAMNKIRVWKIGSLEHKLAPTALASSTLADILGANVGGGTKDIIWGPDIELLETSSDIQSYLGEEKYKPTLMAIYASLGIPPTLTGTFGAGGTTNNFIALKTLVERLNYVRNIIIEFWSEQIRMVQKAMGFRKPAHVEFDIMYLEDPAAMTTLLLNMADRNIISDEFVQRHVKARPDIEGKRLQDETKTRNTKKMDKVSPYHQVDKKHGLKKIALQTGISSPSEVGLELDDKKDGEKSMVEIRETKTTKIKESDNVAPQSPGRPKNSLDQSPRKPKQFSPKLKASIEVWAKQAQAKISKIINPVILDSFGKSSVRSLNSKEFSDLEDIKFEILCNLNVGEDINEQSIAIASQDTDKKIHLEFRNWVEDASQIAGKMSVEQIRDMMASYYVHYNYEGKK
jgi:hypothetical protein